MRHQSIAAHLQTAGDSLSRTLESLRSDTLLAAASQLAKAPKVWLLGLHRLGAGIHVCQLSGVPFQL